MFMLPDLMVEGSFADRNADGDASDLFARVTWNSVCRWLAFDRRLVFVIGRQRQGHEGYAGDPGHGSDNEQGGGRTAVVRIDIIVVGKQQANPRTDQARTQQDQADRQVGSSLQVNLRINPGSARPTSFVHSRKKTGFQSEPNGS